MKITLLTSFLGVMILFGLSFRTFNILFYVGLPLAGEFASAGLKVVGFDIDEKKVRTLNSGRSIIKHVPHSRVKEIVKAGRFKATSNMARLKNVDAILVCVPTPLTINREPDMQFIIKSSETIAKYLQRRQLVILESTTYPGTTEEIVQPILEKSGLKAGVDFYLAFSPERIDPGNKQWSAYNTPKVVGGITPECTRLACDLLSQMGAPVHPVSSPRAAELTKLLENTFRAVNIALVNELALLTERMGIDFWEVIEAAKTKPFGFMPFTPGPGVGGHCIPVDPYYLSWKAREYDYYTEFIELAGEVNQAMTHHVVDLVCQGLNLQGKPLRDAHVLVLGVAFKPDIDDARNSPAERIIELLLSRGARVCYHDPYVPRFQVGDDVFHREAVVLESVPLTEEEITAADCVVIVTDHRSLDYARIVQHAGLVVDTRNATSGIADHREKIVRLGAPLTGL